MALCSSFIAQNPQLLFWARRLAQTGQNIAIKCVIQPDVSPTNLSVFLPPSISLSLYLTNQPQCVPPTVHFIQLVPHQPTSVRSSHCPFHSACTSPTNLSAFLPPLIVLPPSIVHVYFITLHSSPSCTFDRHCGTLILLPALYTCDFYVLNSISISFP